MVPFGRFGSSPVRIVFTDLDGTLLNTSRHVSQENLDCLEQLGQNGIIRVIATGRSWYSFKRVISWPFPADYLIFSSGAGIVDAGSGELLFHANLTLADVALISGHLTEQQTDFMVHHQVPDNHHFVYHGGGGFGPDFACRIRLYQDFAREHTDSVPFPAPAAQVIAVLPHDPDHFLRLKTLLDGYQVTRTTSPLDHRSIWMEVQPRDINKGSAAAWLCTHLGLDRAGAVGIGNDYNDIDLLDFTPRSFLLANAPPELHRQYQLSSSNDEDGFRQAVRKAGAI